MDNLFQIPSYLQSVRTLVDGGIKIDVITQEVSPDQMTQIFGLKGRQGWMLFKLNPIEASDLPSGEAKAGVKVKSPSQRLYNVLYVYWQQNFSANKNFNEWREREMEKIINIYKDQLN